MTENQAVSLSAQKPIACAIAQHKDGDALYRSASGGIFFALAETVIEDGGAVYGAAYDQLRVVHKRCLSIEGIRELQGSKYAQSHLGDTYRQVEADLISGISVLFSGTPCQVAGLNSFLELRRLSQEHLSNLVTVDFVCHGVGSPKALEAYVREKREQGFDIASIDMRSKRYGYRNGTVEVRDASGKAKLESTRINDFTRAYYANIILRPSCHACAFKKLHHNCDITLFDSWRAEEVLGVDQDNLGWSNVLIQSENGQEMFLKASKRFRYKFVPADEIVPAKGGMVLHSASANEMRESFFATLESSGLEAAVGKCLPKGPQDSIREAGKLALSKIGVLDKTSVFLRRRRRGK